MMLITNLIFLESRSFHFLENKIKLLTGSIFNSPNSSPFLPTTVPQSFFFHSIKINARDVEAALQRMFQCLPLGRRLWRIPDQGAKYELPDGKTIH
jgi:hypothetical protein